MSWGDSFIQGFSTAADIKDRRKRQQYEADRDKALRDLQLEVQARDFAGRRGLQGDAQTFQSGEADKDRGFRSGEADKDRTFRTGERIGGQNFAAAQAELERGFRGGEADKDRTFRTGERVATQTFQGGQSDLDRAARAMALDKELGLRRETFGWQKDPTNPQNKYYTASAEYTRSQIQPRFEDGEMSLGKMLSPADQEALDWAKNNPNDPRAAAIKQRLGVK